MPRGRVYKQMNAHCQQCRGACCEVLRVETPTKHHQDWLGGRTVAAGSGFVLVPCVCAHLTDGRCGIEATKPTFCATMEVGGADCKTAVRLLRPELAKEWGW